MAPMVCSFGGVDGGDGQPRREHDHHADEADADGGQAEGADLLAEEHRGEDHGEERRGVAEGGGLGQRQQAEGGEAEAHGRGADQPAPEVAHRVEGVEAVAQVVRPDEPGEDHRDREERAEEHRLARRARAAAAALMQIAISVKTMTERTLRPMPRSGFMGERLVGWLQAGAGGVVPGQCPQWRRLTRGCGGPRVVLPVGPRGVNRGVFTREQFACH